MAIPDPPLERLPPANLQAEQALLGALLANNKAYDRVREFLAPEHFADPLHGQIYQAIARQIEAGQPANVVTLKAEFILEEVGTYLVQLLTAMVGIINAGEYGRAIHDAWSRRLELIHIQMAIVKNAEPDAAGQRWGVEGDQFAIDRSITPTDQDVASNPLRQQLQAAICAAAAELADAAKRVSNTRTWSRLSATAQALHDLMVAQTSMTLPNRLGEAYATMLRLGGFLETDIRVHRNSKGIDDPLDPDIRGALAHLVRIAAPWLRDFPTVAAWDDAAGKTLVRAGRTHSAGRDGERAAKGGNRRIPLGTAWHADLLNARSCPRQHFRRANGSHSSWFSNQHPGIVGRKSANGNWTTTNRSEDP